MPVDFSRNFAELDNDPLGRKFLQDGIYYLADGVTVYSPGDPVEPEPVQEPPLDTSKREANATIRAAYEAAVRAPLVDGDYSYNPAELLELFDQRTTLTNAVEVTQTTIETGESATVTLTDAEFDALIAALLARNTPIAAAYKVHLANVRAATTLAAVQAVVEAL